MMLLGLASLTVLSIVESHLLDDRPWFRPKQAAAPPAAPPVSPPVSAPASPPGPVNTLVIGDSWAKQSFNYLADDCVGKTVGNFGVDASLAVNWASGACPQIPGGSCSVAAAAQGAPGAQYVWLSVGGNDFVGGGCSASVPDLATVIGGVLAAVKSALPTAKILMTGYCTPPSTAATFVPPACRAASQIGPLNDAVKMACDATVGCTFVDATSACGGSRVAFSDASLFANPMHLNQMGYQRFFQQPGVQSALACGVPAKYTVGSEVMLRGGSSKGAASAFVVLGLAGLVAAVTIFRQRRRVAIGVLATEESLQAIMADESASD